MAFFPVFIDLSKKRILVAGGGYIAERRTRAILPFAGSVKVTAPCVDESFSGFIEETEPGKIIFLKREFRMEDLDDADMVLMCTDDAELNRTVTAECRKRGIPANNASDKSDCDFYFPGLVVRDPVVIGITAGGKAHRLVKEMREKIEESVGEVLEKM